MQRPQIWRHVRNRKQGCVWELKLFCVRSHLLYSVSMDHCFMGPPFCLNIPPCTINTRNLRFGLFIQNIRFYRSTVFGSKLNIVVSVMQFNGPSAPVHQPYIPIYRPNIDLNFEKYVAIIDQNPQVSEKIWKWIKSC